MSGANKFGILATLIINVPCVVFGQSPLSNILKGGPGPCSMTAQTPSNPSAKLVCQAPQPITDYVARRTRGADASSRVAEANRIVTELKAALTIPGPADSVAEKHLMAGEFGEAASVLKTRLQGLGPEQRAFKAKLLYQLGTVYDVQGKWREAGDNFLAAFDMDKQPEYCMALASLLADMQEARAPTMWNACIKETRALAAKAPERYEPKLAEMLQSAGWFNETTEGMTPYLDESNRLFRKYALLNPGKYRVLYIKNLLIVSFFLQDRLSDDNLTEEVEKREAQKGLDYVTDAMALLHKLPPKGSVFTQEQQQSLAETGIFETGALTNEQLGGLFEVLAGGFKQTISGEHKDVDALRYFENAEQLFSRLLSARGDQEDRFLLAMSTGMHATAVLSSGDTAVGCAIYRHFLDRLHTLPKSSQKEVGDMVSTELASSCTVQK